MLFNSPEFTSKALKTNELFPLWNPFMGYGKPCIADPEMSFFYPGIWFYYLFSPSGGVVAIYTFHVFLAGVAVYALARHWRFDIFPALLAAVSLMFSTWLLAAIEFRALSAAFTLGPLELLALSCLIERYRNPETAGIGKNFWLIVAMGGVVALQYLTGYPQMMLYNQLLVGLFLVARLLWLGNLKLLPKLAIPLALAGLITVGLSMVQLLPSWEFIKYSERGVSVDPGLDMASIHPDHLLTLLFPYLDGRPGYPRENWGQTIYEFWIGTCHVGILPLILLTFSPFCLKRFTGKLGGDELHRFLFVFFCGVAVFGLLMAFGKYFPLYMFFYNIVPGFDHFRWPSKFLVFVLYALCLLGALGCQQLLNWQKQEQRPKAAGAVLSVWAVLLVVVGVGWFLATGGPTLFEVLTNNRFVSTPEHHHAALQDYGRTALFLFAGLLVVYAVFSKRLSQTVSGLLIVGLAFANLWSVSREIQPIMDDDIYELVPKTIHAPLQPMQPDHVFSVNPDSGQFIYGSRDRALYQWDKDAAVHSILQPYGIFQAHAIGLAIQRYQALYRLIPQLPPREAERLADIMNIRYIVASERFEKVYWENGSKDVKVIERPSFLPVAYVVDDWKMRPDLQAALQTLLDPAFDPRRAVVIEPLKGTPSPRCSPNAISTVPPGEVKSIHILWNSVDLSVSATRDSLLVLTHTWFPGWKATVNGNPVPIYQANGLFRAIPLQPGMNQVHFEYHPWQFFVGLTITLATLLILCSVAVIQFAVRRLR